MSRKDDVRRLESVLRSVLGTEAFYRARESHAEGRGHAPGISGYWIHPRKGVHPLSREEHHSAFFQAHPELFGDDLPAAYADGWISIRRWAGSDPKWAVVYGRWRAAVSALRAWAASVVQERPEEGSVRVFFTAVDDAATPPETTLLGLASGYLREERVRETDKEGNT